MSTATEPTLASRSAVTAGRGGRSSSTHSSSKKSAASQQQGVVHHHVGGITDEALRHFYDAMSLVHPTEKVGWARAQTHCPPSVLQHECCPCYFVLACQFNPWEAAVRMCQYWKERIALFEERAFETMTLGSDTIPPTGLTKGDVKILERGEYYLLPKDNKGASVLFVDPHKLEPYMFEEVSSRLRVLWYVLHACFTSGGDCSHRLVVVHACYKTPLSGQLASSIWQFSTGSAKAPRVLPVEVDAIHLVTLQTKTGTGPFIQFVLSTAAAMSGSYLARLHKAHHGVAKSGTYANVQEEESLAKANLLGKLSQYGFTKKSLPEWVGGTFGMDDFSTWLKRRRTFERRAFWTAEQRIQQRRDANRYHSTQKRRRRDQELFELQEQVIALEAENARARDVGEHLEQLVMAANQAIVEGNVPQPTPYPVVEPLRSRCEVVTTPADLPCMTLTVGMDDSVGSLSTISYLAPTGLSPSVTSHGPQWSIDTSMPSFGPVSRIDTMALESSHVAAMSADPTDIPSLVSAIDWIHDPNPSCGSVRGPLEPDPITARITIAPTMNSNSVLPISDASQDAVAIPVNTGQGPQYLARHNVNGIKTSDMNSLTSDVFQTAIRESILPPVDDGPALLPLQRGSQPAHSMGCGALPPQVAYPQPVVETWGCPDDASVSFLAMSAACPGETGAPPGPVLPSMTPAPTMILCPPAGSNDACRVVLQTPSPPWNGEDDGARRESAEAPTQPLIIDNGRGTADPDVDLSILFDLDWS